MCVSLRLKAQAKLAQLGNSGSRRAVRQYDDVGGQRPAGQDKPRGSHEKPESSDRDAPQAPENIDFLCRALPAAAALRRRVDKLASTPTADQDAKLRAGTFVKLARPVASEPDVLWCLAVQLTGDRHAEPSAEAFMRALRAELESAPAPVVA